MAVIEAQNLTKVYDGKVRAVDSVSLEVFESEIFGFLGPNGAGKTTLIHMLCTLLKPTSGVAKVSGYDVAKEPDLVRKSIGIVFQDPSLDENLTGRENMDFHGRLYGMATGEIKERITELLKMVELEDKADRLVKTYSGGMRRRLEIARGLMHHPKVLFLDEPTLGLDPQTRRHIWDYIRELNRRERVTIFLTTHYMDEADSLCNRVAIIDYGKIIACDEPKHLKDLLGGDIIELKVAGKADALASAFKENQAVRAVKTAEGTLCLTVYDAAKMIPQVLELAESLEVEVNSVDLHRPTLDDVFLTYTGRRIREEETSPMERMRLLMKR
ncbi:ATP-binding cassette domain-containing protein [Candidatus Hecatella orcuttiae]|uniref:ATP-binding cassette domain-containing protein n=1 Tax=Candidatus Hecatella orcuttiae TaxID=1935119 RepID=UPI00286814BB|nr:ATP-binding cassette domain-containing protein [Candidatus Hecatella orcuttiae]